MEDFLSFAVIGDARIEAEFSLLGRSNSIVITFPIWDPVVVAATYLFSCHFLSGDGRHCRVCGYRMVRTVVLLYTVP